MRQIRKQAEPAIFTTWKASRGAQLVGTTWRRFGRSQPAVKAAVGNALAGEQGGNCCYCGGLIGRGSRHIEHFKPQSGATARYRYDWSNLLSSCEGEPPTNAGINQREEHCGHAKKNWYDAKLTINPLNARAVSGLKFYLNGTVRPYSTRSVAAASTILHLKLDAASLRRRRAAAIAQALSDTLLMTRADWLALYVDMDTTGTYAEFSGTMKSLYERSWTNTFL